MKKSYLQPETEVLNVNVIQMLAASITNVGGDSDLEIGEGTAPGEADVKQSVIEEDFWK